MDLKSACRDLKRALVLQPVAVAEGEVDLVPGGFRADEPLVDRRGYGFTLGVALRASAGGAHRDAGPDQAAEEAGRLIPRGGFEADLAVAVEPVEVQARVVPHHVDHVVAGERRRCAAEI